jgi:DNA-binding NarL/FixJ family response regulator
MTADPLSVVIVEDHAVFSEKLAVLLGHVPGVRVVGRAVDVPTGRDRIRRLRPDVAILDVRLPQGSGFDLLADVKGASPSPVAFVMTAYADPEYQKRSMALGADFFFEKSTGLKEMLKVIKSIRDRKRLCKDDKNLSG